MLSSRFFERRDSVYFAAWRREGSGAGRRSGTGFATSCTESTDSQILEEHVVCNRPKKKSSFQSIFLCTGPYTHGARLDSLFHVALSGSVPFGGAPSPRRRLFVETLASCGSPMSSGQLITEAPAGRLGQPPSRSQMRRAQRRARYQLGKRPEKCAGCSPSFKNPFTRPTDAASKR